MPPSSQPDAAIEEATLLALTAAGDRDALRLLYTRYSGPLFSLAVRFVGNPSEAEELLQDAFVKIWRNAGTYDPRKARPFTWAVTIMRRTCIDHLRKRRHSLATTPLPSETEAQKVFAMAENVRPTAEAHEDAGRLEDALADTPANQRAALELALFSDLTHEEIARQLQQPVGTIKTWIRRGLVDLRTTLSDSAP